MILNIFILIKNYFTEYVRQQVINYLKMKITTNKLLTRKVKKMEHVGFISVRLSPPSTTKNVNKKRQKLVNGQSDFDETNKFGITMKNYTRQNKRINDSNQFYAQPKLTRMTCQSWVEIKQSRQIELPN
jgi:hypothetical protein